jgi:hypothetical protein
LNVATPASRREYLVVTFIFVILTAILLYPLSFNPGTLGRVDNNDGQFSIWNVAWVARTLIVDPLHVLDANIFYPHRWTLAYSEMNLGAGLLAVPAYWATRNPYAAHNFVLLLSFVMSGVGMYALARYLVHDARAAVVAGISFAYAPHLFSHLPHIQLLMTAFIPITLLALHRMADEPSARRGVGLGVALAIQALLCAYYVVFLALIVSFAVLFLAASRNYWRTLPYWKAVAIAALVAAVLVIPLFIPYLMLQRETGFTRTLDAARTYSANFSAYLASAAAAHSWMLPYLMRWFGRWNEVLFPGFLPVMFGLAGLVLGWRAGGRLRETAALYASVGVLAFWASFGPQAGLYTFLHNVVPAFSFMRAPSRFGLAVIFALSVLVAISVARLLARTSKPWPLGALIILIAAVESYVPLTGGVFRAVSPVAGVYRILAIQPRGAVLELPAYSSRLRFGRTQYMLASTAHWQPLVNAYSDHIPVEFQRDLPLYDEVPTAASLRLLKNQNIKYVIFHTDRFGDTRDALMARLIEFHPYMRHLYSDRRTMLFEILDAPAAPPPPQS